MAGRIREPLWVDRVVIDAVHVDMVRSHGGMPGVRDENAREAALARSRHQWRYRRATDLATLAAAYGYGLARSHPYIDGNKRMAFMAMAIFLGLNGKEIETGEDDVVAVMLRLAAGRLSERVLATWLRSRLVPYGGD